MNIFHISSQLSPPPTASLLLMRNVCLKDLLRPVTANFSPQCHDRDQEKSEESHYH